MRRIKPLALTVILLGLLGCTKEPAVKVYSIDVASVDAVQSSPYKNKSIKVVNPQGLKNKISQKMHFSYSSIDRGTYQNSEWSNTMTKLLQGTFIEVLDHYKMS